MQTPDARSGFLTSKQARILTIVLICQASLFYGFSRREVIPVSPALSETPTSFGEWRMISEGVVEKEVQDVLKADDLLNRTYGSPAHPVPAYLFVAYFRSQRTGQAPHSPKNCLPGNGWVQQDAKTVYIPIEGREPVEANLYVVAKGDSKSVVLYWYQSRDRTVASEYSAKFYVVADALRYNRTDTALVKVVIPVVGKQADAAEKTAIEFVQSFFKPLRQYFPA